MTDDPPPYSPSSSAGPSYQPASTAPTNDNDRFAFLSQFDTIFLIDDSGSMSGSNWRETSAAIAAIADTCVHYDDDGIDIHFLNHAPIHPHIRTAAAVREIFQSTHPRGRTFLGSRIHAILDPYLAACERGKAMKPINLIVITDGEADDDPETVIKEAAKRLDAMKAAPWQVGIQFFQVGSDAKATRFLQELDDELSARHGGIRDIVDTQPYRAAGGSVINGEGILKTVLGAVNKRQDRKKGEELHSRR